MEDIKYDLLHIMDYKDDEAKLQDIANSAVAYIKHLEHKLDTSGLSSSYVERIKLKASEKSSNSALRL